MGRCVGSWTEPIRHGVGWIGSGHLTRGNNWTSVGSSAKCCPPLAAEYSRKFVHQSILYHIIREGTPPARVIGIILDVGGSFISWTTGFVLRIVHTWTQHPSNKWQFFITYRTVKSCNWVATIISQLWKRVCTAPTGSHQRPWIDTVKFYHWGYIGQYGTRCCFMNWTNQNRCWPAKKWSPNKRVSFNVSWFFGHVLPTVVCWTVEKVDIPANTTQQKPLMDTANESHWDNPGCLAG